MFNIKFSKYDISWLSYKKTYIDSTQIKKESNKPDFHPKRKGNTAFKHVIVPDNNSTIIRQYNITFLVSKIIYLELHLSTGFTRSRYK